MAIERIFLVTFVLANLYFAEFSFANQVPLCPDEQAQSGCESIYKDDYLAAEKLKIALKNDDRGAVAELIDYPLDRDMPLPPIRSQKEFIAHWDEYFDDESRREIIAAKAEEIGWRGVQIANGSIWFQKGNVAAINYRTEKYRKNLRTAIEAESATLYPSARNYDSIRFQCQTANLQVRAQYHKKDLRYFAWKKGDALSSKPELELHSGEIIFQGSGGGYDLMFTSGVYNYQVQVTGICAEDCNNYLTVFKNGQVIYQQTCT